MNNGVLIAIIAMVGVGIWFVLDYLTPAGFPSWVVFIFIAAAIIAVPFINKKKDGQ